MSATRHCKRRASLHVLVITVLSFPVSIFAQDTDDASTEPIRVLTTVAMVHAEIEAIRFEMGKPRVAPLELFVDDVAPRETYFQAKTLWEKANRLCFEITREERSAPEQPNTDLHIEHVQTIVEAALERLRRVRAHFGITSEFSVVERHDAKTSSDLLLAIVHANRQLNTLLHHEFSPEDVFQQVTLALRYSTGLRALFPGKRMPPTPEFERGKRPADVYRRLLVCLGRVRTLSTSTGATMLKIDTSRLDFDQVTPSDVYDIASLLVAELAYLHSRVIRTAPRYEAYAPGRKFPSHVYQRVGILEAQLAELEELNIQDPDRLRLAKR